MPKTETPVSQLKINRLTKTQFDSASDLSDTEIYAVDPEFTGGKLLKTDSDGNIVESTATEADATAGGTAIQGVKVNGTELTPDANKKVDVTVPTDTNDLTNGAGYITGITSSDVTTALGYTPYNSTNPSGYQANVIETVKVNGTALTPSNKAVDITVPTDTNELSNGAGYITNSALSNYVTLNTLQTLSSGKKIFANDVTMAGNQTALLATISNSNTTTSDNAWVGRYICGAKNLTFLMGTYRTMAGIGVHTWTNAQTGAGAGWGDFYLNPDGDKTVYVGGYWWTKNSGWFKVKNSSNTSGLIQVNKGSISSPSWKDVAYKGENISDFNNNAGYITSASLPTTYVHEQGVASAVWTVQHNLNKYPSVTVVDSSENVLIADVKYIDVNTVQITMNGASKGRAYLN